MDMQVPSAAAEAPLRAGSAARGPEAAGLRPPYRNLAVLASAAMERAPEAECIAFRGRSWSNGEVQVWSRAIARSIRARSRDGQGNGRVGLLVGRGPGMVAGFLGILMADRSAILCDPMGPEVRTRTVLADAGPDLVLVDRAASAARFGIPADRVIAIGEPEAASASEPFEPSRGDGTQAAYILYTSGSTGRPKGVVCNHLGICNLVEHPPWDGPLGSASRLLLTSPVTFDPFVSDIVLALRHGMPLVIADEGDTASGAALADLMRREAVTIADLPPSLLSALPPGPFPALRIVMTGGETCPQRVVDDWAPRVALYNCYGPTETAVEVMRWRWNAGEPARRIGRPIPNVVLKIVDPAGEEADEGELLIGGPMVALGYLGLPETTAARFFVCRETGLRFYRTGDRVRRRDGIHEFLGRLDDQIKLSGVRIEPEEVRRAIEAIAGVSQAAIVVRELGGHLSLVGFYSPGNAPEPAALLEELSQRLLPVMIPAQLFKLDAIPTGTSGKVDLDALKRRIPARQVAAGDGPAPAPDPDADSAPLSEVGRALAALWQRLLNCGSVRPTDNFFGLGGDSLRLTQMIFAINQTYRVRLTPSVVRGLTDFAALVSFIEQASKGSPAPALEPRRAHPRGAAGE